MYEKYVSSESHCGLKQCDCFEGIHQDHRVDPVKNLVQNKVMKMKHVVIVDSQVLLKFMDVFIDGKIK